MKLKGKVKFVNKDKNQFFSVLKKRVDHYFKERNISKYANTQMVIKSIVLLSAYILSFVAILTLQLPVWANMLLWFAMGVALAGIGMSVMHDANHGAYSPNKTINRIMAHTLNLLGGSTLNWKLQHNILHHTYTNIADMDDDVENKLALKFSPNTERKGFHQYQYIYAFFFYGLLTLYWAALKDFVQFFKYNANGVNPNNRKENTNFLIRMVIDKIVYFFILLFIPIYFFHLPALQVITGFLLMHFVGGIILTVVFQLAHVVEGATHPLPDMQGNIDNHWAVHQLYTTVNFSRKNKWLSWYVGGLNFQVEHHLFPRMCHVHYPNIAPIVKQTAEEFGVPYQENETFGEALKSHVVALKQIGRLPDINEALA
ncbi:MAG: fatty acid desaturase family protein [Thermonemataceae bacterium]